MEQMVSDTLAVLHLNNQLFISGSMGHKKLARFLISKLFHYYINFFEDWWRLDLFQIDILYCKMVDWFEVFFS